MPINFSKCFQLSTDEVYIRKVLKAKHRLRTRLQHNLLAAKRSEIISVISRHFLVSFSIDLPYVLLQSFFRHIFRYSSLFEGETTLHLHFHYVFILG
jgi:hypothetical protein